MDNIWVCVWMDLCLEAAVFMMQGILTIIITIQGSGTRPGFMLNLGILKISFFFLSIFSPCRGHYRNPFPNPAIN